MFRKDKIVKKEDGVDDEKIEEVINGFLFLKIEIYMLKISIDYDEWGEEFLEMI